MCQEYFGAGRRAFAVMWLRRHMPAASLGQDATLSFVVRGRGKRKGIPLQINEGQPFLFGSKPY